MEYLALGDSYTIGESVELKDSWPHQLVSYLNKNGYSFKEPNIIATTGWTTDELVVEIVKRSVFKKYDLVSLLIGVNNQYRGYSKKQYEQEFEYLVQRALLFADNDPEKVFIVAIPDYGVTPFGQQSNPDKIDRELIWYNNKAKEIADQYEVLFVDIFEVSKQALEDPLLTAEDNLHPSPQMYTLWVEEIIDHLKELKLDK
ncbi:MAG: SGNH/GDSL hydrolase family protein [Bacteroidota bacterium]